MRVQNIKLSLMIAAILALMLFVTMRETHLPFSASAKGHSEPSAVTFNKDIAPIIFKNCASCHRPGEVAPFSLLNYRDTAKRAGQIAAVTKSRYMPPWKAEPGYGEFHDERRLTDEQIALIQRWAGSGAVEGDPKDLPPMPQFTEGWQLGTPDLVLKMPHAFTIKAEGPDIYQCFVIPLNLPEDKYISAFEFRPGNRRVVHHSLLFLDSSGAARKKDEADPEIGFRSFGGPGFLPTGTLGGWAPGAFPHYLPAGIVKIIKSGSDLVIQNHYHPSGKVETDQSTIGIYFSKTPPQKLARAIPLIRFDLDIPPGEKLYKTLVSFTTPIDLQAIGITPHMHLLGREMKITAFLPGGAVQPLIWIKDWDFNWQGQYLYARPVRLPKGTRLEMEAYYDNSPDNPRNPNTPPKRVRWGEQTTDEMALCGVQVVAENQEELPQLRLAIAQQLRPRLRANGASGTFLEDWIKQRQQ